jgi:hypothetical protein
MPPLVVLIMLGDKKVYVSERSQKVKNIKDKKGYLPDCFPYSLDLLGTQLPIGRSHKHR